MRSHIRAGFSIAAVLVLGIATPLLACLWDYDTLRAEAKGLPGLVEILTGRFERQPPQYYTMRLTRAEAAIAKDPRDLAAYDDAAVACDRLHRGDEAVAWMKRKKEQLDTMDPASSEAREHLYRYHANLGTMLAHRWLRAGGGAAGDRSDPAGLAEGRAHIARAIELNPEAHFGREKYQLRAMDWILSPPARESWRQDELVHIFWDVPNFESGHGLGGLAKTEYNDAAAGLSGLIVLGDAWESLDVHYALMLALQDRGDAAMARLARQRCLELVEGGRRSLHPENPTEKPSCAG